MRNLKTILKLTFNIRKVTLTVCPSLTLVLVFLFLSLNCLIGKLQLTLHFICPICPTKMVGNLV